MTKQYILWACLMGLLAYSHAQHVFQITGAKVNIKSNTHLVLKNTSWGNKGGELLGDSGVVVFKGNQSDTIGGSTATTFGHLYLDKSGASVELRQTAQVKDSLDLAAGNLKLEDQNLRMLSGSGSSEGSAGSYIQTSGTGQLQSEVGSGNVLFPIGGTTYRPAILQNNGTLDFFGMRVTDSVLTQGNQGSKISQEALAASWVLAEENAGGSSLHMTLQWNGSDEQTGFDRASAYITTYASAWDTQPPGAASGSDPYQISRANLGGGGTFAIFSQDIQAPVINCPPNIVQGNDQNDCGAVITYTTPVGTDNSVNPATSLSSGLGSGATFPIGTTTEVYTVTDASGNTASCSFSVTINDTQAPAINCPQPIVQGNDQGSCDAIVSYAVTASDNCPGESISQLSGQASGSSYAVGSTVNHTFQVTDAAGNTASCSFSIGVDDIESPTPNCPPSVSLSNDPGQCGATFTYALNSTDNCGIRNTIQGAGLPSGSIFPLGSTLNGFTVTDVNGNRNVCTFTVTVSDTELPQAICPANITVSNDAGQCDAVVTFSVTTSDNCTGESLTQTGGLPSGSTFPLGSTHNEFTVTDASGNTASCTFSVTVNDTQSPTLSCPQNILTVNDAGDCGAVVSFSLTSDDNCAGEYVDQTAGLASGSSFPIGLTSNTFTVTDAAGNTASCSFDVVVMDDELPQISCPSSMSLSNDQGVCGAAYTYLVTASDNCTGESISQQGGLPPGSIFPIGTTVNSFTVTDASGNTAACSFDVIVTDDENPVISCPTSLNLANDPGQCGRTVTYLIPNGTDNCSSSTQMTAGMGSGSQFPIGTTTESYTVTDASGKTASCAFSITINDAEQPVLTLNGNNPVILCEGDSYVEAGATAADNCDASVGQNITVNSSAVNSLQAGSYTVTYDVTDIHGNTAHLSRTVIVRQEPAQLAPQNCGSCNQIRFDFCEGEAAPDLEVLLIANSTYELGADFLWYADNSGSQGNSIASPVPNMNNNNTRFYWVSQIIGSCESASRRVRVRVRKTSTVVLDLPAIGCGTAQLDLAAWVSDTRGIATGFTFYDSDPDAGSPTPVGSVTASSGQVNSGQYAVVSLPSGPVTYYAVASNHTGCQVTGSDDVASAAGASLDAIPNLTVNAGSLVNIAFNSPDATHIFWFNPSSFNNPYIGLLGNFGIGNLVFTAQNFGSSPQTAMLRAIAYNGNCAGQVRDFSITVNPGVGSRQAAGNSLQLAAIRLNAHDVQLDWQIEYEFALTHIEIEKLKNDGEWEKIAQTDLLADSYIDRSGMGNVTKYRLKLIHPDGRAIWSQEVEVNFDYFDSRRFSLYPNPSDGRFQLRAAGPLEGEWRYKLSDGMGRTILTGKLQGSETAFDISGLPTAHYFLLITSPEGKQYLQQVSKQ